MNPVSLQLFDVLLLLSIVGLAWASLASPDDRRSVILFMALGLLLALAWGRLLAPDVALAEAAIGAGLSGALLLAALREQSRREAPGATEAVAKRGSSRLQAMTQWVVTLLCAGLAGILGWVLVHIFAGPPLDRLTQVVSANLGVSGVSNPVTAVLLNFRGYDTLLELAVLLTAVLGILALGPGRAGYQPAGPIFDALARSLAPLLILVSAYLLWVGAHAPGGAFQAGATLAAAGVVLRLAGRQRIGLPPEGALRLVMTAGVGLFLAVGLSLLLLGRPFLGYPPAWAGALILVIESAAMLSIAATLVLAFIGGRLPAHGIPAAEPATRRHEAITTAAAPERGGEEQSGC